MTTSRRLAGIITLPLPATGQFGPNHTVVEVITPDHWADTDPFILLMDDRIDGHMHAGPHPHAGVETVSFLVSGSMSAEGSDVALELDHRRQRESARAGTGRVA